MQIVSMDPGSSHTGLAMLDVELSLPSALKDWALCPLRSDGLSESFDRQVLNVFRRWCAPDAGPRYLLVERPPPTARKDTGHGFQAVIGDVQGYIGGMAVGWWLHEHQPVLGRVRPGNGADDGWRASVLLESARRGRLVERPRRKGRRPRTSVRGQRGKPRRDPAGGFILPYTGCEHTVRCQDFAALQAAPHQCAACAAPQRDATADEVRAAWKKLACDFVEWLWPEQYQAIVADASSRAKTVKRPHEYLGVSDVCEAICIGVHGRRLLLDARKP